MQGSGFRVQGSGCRVQGPGSRVETVVEALSRAGLLLDTERMSPPGYLVECLGFRVWGLGFGVDYLGLRVWTCNVVVQARHPR